MMRTRNIAVWSVGIAGCILLGQVNARDEAAPERERGRERERNRTGMTEQMQARRQANLEFWKSVEGRDPGDALPDVKAHLRTQHEENLAAMEARYAQIVARAGARGDEQEGAGAHRKENLQRLEERHAERKTAMEESFAETIRNLDALAEKDDLTWADVRAAARPGRARQELRGDREGRPKGAQRPERGAPGERGERDKGERGERGRQERDGERDRGRDRDGQQGQKNREGGRPAK